MKQTVCIGDKFNRLLATEQAAPTKYGKTRFKWKCDCGTTKIIEATTVKHHRIKSCGCLQKEVARNYNFKGDGVAGFNAVKKNYKRHARERSLLFQLTDDFLKNLFSDLCHYCKMPPSNKWTHQHNKELKFMYNGIDRIDNSKGYITDNVITCCCKCNRMKSDLTYNEFLNHIKSIAKAKEWV